MANNIGIKDLVEKTLDASSFRDRVIANNIANVNTPGFRRSKVHFEDMFAKEIREGDLEGAIKVTPDVYIPKDTPVSANGNDVDIELEMGELIKNSANRKIYIRVLKKMYQQMERAIGIE